jgi:16S rRNA (cytosine1402-N4)-methyltransferase
MQQTESQILHTPVLLNETLSLLRAVDGGLFVDATLGLGGHTEAILENSQQSEVIGIDQDAHAIEATRRRLDRFGGRIRIVHANFSAIKKVVRDLTAESPKGILADLGVSSLQFDSETRGFSFRFNAPLDMRMNPDSGDETAAEILADRSEEEIADIIYEFGEERRSRKIARWIVERRKKGEPVETTKQLADLVERAIGRGGKDKIHPATRTFQALRIAVNHELDIIEGFLKDSVYILTTGGVLAVITFHSLEDRIVKQTFQYLAGKCICPPRIPKCVCGAEKRVEIITKKPVVPGDEEIAANPRARSSKLRACKKLI